MRKNSIVPVILSGGSGSRLWPLSKKNLPKQFAISFNDATLFQGTITRLKGINNLSIPVIISNKKYRKLIEQQLIGSCDNYQLILEPVGRNTAPAAAISAMLALSDDPILLVLPADHVISEEKRFVSAINTALEFAKQGALITFGAKITYPETAYGYIKPSKQLSEGVYEIAKFIEKPDRRHAEQYCHAKNYFWNCGMFMFRASVFLRELRQYAPEIFACCEPIASNFKGKILPQSFAKCPSNSIDYAVMEHTKKGVVVKLDAGWSDMGSWSSLWDFKPKDSHGNVIIGDVAAHEVSNSYLHAAKRKLVVLGVKDCIVVETEDAVLVAHKDLCQDIKKIVEG